MDWIERVGNLHIHSWHSDGTGSHEQIAAAAAAAGLDWVLVTDHNRYLPEHEGWRRGVLVLVGEEVHDPARDLNHALVLAAGQEMASFGEDAQRLIDEVNAHGGMVFLAHPFERSGAYAREPEINWVDWDVRGFHGLEIWNYMSEWKSYLYNLPRTLLYAFRPDLAIRGPHPETLARWDALLTERRVVAVGGSDAHAIVYRMGPLRRRLFSYRHLFGAVNTHLFLRADWQRDSRTDGLLVYEALREGRAFVADDGLAPARGFVFGAEAAGAIHPLGAEVPLEGEVRLVAEAPHPARLRLIRNGEVVAEVQGRRLEYACRAPGAYRLEAYRRAHRRERGWIFANPLYVRAP